MRLLIEDLSLADRPVSLAKQNLYVFLGLYPEFKASTTSLTVCGRPVMLQELAYLLGAQQFFAGDDFAVVDHAPVAIAAQRGWQQERGGN